MEKTSVQVNNFTFDLNDPLIIYNNKHIVFTPLEFKLLTYLLINKNRTVTRSMLHNNVFLYSEDRNIDMYIGYLRRKLENIITISTIRGFGYGIFDKFQKNEN